MTEQEIDEMAGDYYPDTTSESKPEDFGRVAGRVLALDYGLSDASEVSERRMYYADRAKALV